MKNLKKLFAIIPVFLILLAGCGSGGASNASDDGTIDGKLTIGMWESSDAEKDAVKKTMDEFSEQTGVDMDVRVYTDYSQQLSTELKSGTAPDVFYVDSSVVVNYIEDGAIMPLNDYIDQEDLDDVFPEILDIFTKDDQVYALPKDWSPLAIYCNEDLLEQAGSSCGEIPKDLESWGDYITKVQKSMPKNTYVWGGTNIIERNMQWLMADGASFITEDGKANLEDPAVVENAKFLAKFWSTPGFVDVADLGYESEDGPFVTGETAIMVTGAWNQGTIATDAPDMNYQMLPLPSFKGEVISPASSVGWGVNSNSKNVDAAVEFVKFASNEGMKIMCEDQGAIPARYSVSEELDAENNPKYAPFLAVKDNIEPIQFSTFTGDLSAEWTNVIPQVKSGELTFEEAFKKIDETINSQLEQFNE